MLWVPSRAMAHIELDNLLADANLPINRPALIDGGYSISSISLSPAGPLTLESGCIFVPWFTRDGFPVCHVRTNYTGVVINRYPENGDSPVTVREAAQQGFRHPWLSEQKIEEHRPDARVEFAVPAYNVRRGYLLLDGNHRSIATVRAGVEYNIELRIIHGPIDRRVLPDLGVFVASHAS
jgi:hypothetical protein